MHIKDKDDDGDEDEQCFWGEQIEDRAFVAETRSEEFMTFSQTVSVLKWREFEISHALAQNEARGQRNNICCLRRRTRRSFY